MQCTGEWSGRRPLMILLNIHRYKNLPYIVRRQFRGLLNILCILLFSVVIISLLRQVGHFLQRYTGSHQVSSHPLTGMGFFRGNYLTDLDDMVRQLQEAHESRRLERKLRTFLKAALLIVDEVGYLPPFQAPGSFGFSDGEPTI